VTAAISASPKASIRSRSINSSTPWSSGRDQPPSHRSHFPGHRSGRHAPRIRRADRLDHLGPRRPIVGQVVSFRQSPSGSFGCARSSLVDLVS
jgi:hypothetical protein